MNDVAIINPETGEVMQAGAVASFQQTEIPLAVRLAKVELDQAISTAKAYPRSLQRVRDSISALVMLDEETAAECVYALPRAGKPVKGPSVRFAEIIASQYGNCKVGARVVDVNRAEKYVEAEGVFIDLETGLHNTSRVRRRIVDSKGRLYNDDMILVTGNAACSIARREAVLKSVPKALWRKAYDEAEGVIAGDVKTLTVRREGAIKAFAVWGVTPDQIFSALDVEGLDEIGLDEIGTLTAMFKAIKGGEQKVEDYFPAKANAAAGVEAAKGTAAKLAALAGGASEDKPKEDERAQAAEQRHAEDRAEAQRQHEEDVKTRAAETPKEEEKARDEAAPEKTEGRAEAGSEAAADKAPAGDAPEDATATAYQRGRKAFTRGMKLDAVPSDLKKTEALVEAWVEGWKDARDEAEPGGEN